MNNNEIGDVIYKEVPQMKKIWMPARKRVFAFLIITIYIVNLIAIIGSDTVTINDILIKLLFFPLIIMIFYISIVQLLTKATTYTLRTTGLEFHSTIGIYKTTNPLIIPFDSILWIGPYPIYYKDREHLFKSYRIGSGDYGSFPTFRNFQWDGWNEYVGGYLLIIKGISITKTVVFWPSNIFLTKLDNELKNNNFYEIINFSLD